MELLNKIKEMIEPILQSNDVYLDDIEYVQEFLLKKMKVF